MKEMMTYLLKIIYAIALFCGGLKIAYLEMLYENFLLFVFFLIVVAIIGYELLDFFLRRLLGKEIDRSQILRRVIWLITEWAITLTVWKYVYLFVKNGSISLAWALSISVLHAILMIRINKPIQKWIKAN